MKLILRHLAVLWAVFGAASQARSAYIYWTDTASSTPSRGGDIRRANADGSNQQMLVTGLNSPNGIRLDPSDGTMYWVDSAYKLPTTNGDIRRANLDGSGGKTLFTLNQPVDLALDLAGGRIYLTDGGNQNIVRANLDGTNRQTIISSPANGGIALDLAAGKLYWSVGPSLNPGTGSIHQANLNGTGATTLISGVTTPAGVALDLAAGKIYWTEVNPKVTNGGDIRRANLDGSGQEVIVQSLPLPVGLTLDSGTGKIYWTDYGTLASITGSDINIVPMTGDIRRANLDGSGQETLITGVTEPGGVAVAVPEPSALLLLGIVSCGVTRRRRCLATLSRRCA